MVIADQIVILGKGDAHRLGDPALTSDQQRAGQRRFTGAVPPQGFRLRNSQLFGQERAWAGVDDL